jgi:hypothetical protein
MSFPLSSLSPKLQAQAAKELYGSKPASAGVSRPLAAPIRQKAGPRLNKLETAFLGYLKAICGDPGWICQQAIKLQLANGCWYTPDFIRITLKSAVATAYEVKGFMRDDANVKLKVAASLYPWIAFYLVQRKKGQWIQTRVLP